MICEIAGLVIREQQQVGTALVIMTPLPSRERNGRPKFLSVVSLTVELELAKFRARVRLPHFAPILGEDMIDNMTGLQQGLLFGLVAGGTVASLLDAYYTSLGLSKGLKEMNPINAYLFLKIGVALTTFIEVAAFIFVSVGMSVVSPMFSFIYAGAITALETYMAIRNKKLLK